MNSLALLIGKIAQSLRLNHWVSKQGKLTVRPKRKLFDCNQVAAIIVALVPFLCFLKCEADTLTGPFVAGTGHQSVIQNGDFETGTTADWSPVEKQGDFLISTTRAFGGTYSVRSRAYLPPAGVGYAAVYSQTVAVTPGKAYVLSAFFYAGDMIEGAIYVDLNDANFEPFEPTRDAARGIPGVKEWTFGWGTIVVPAGVTQVTIRMVQDGVFSYSQYGFIDNVALTLANEFVPPTVVPSEPPVLTLEAYAGITIKGAIGGNFQIQWTTNLSANSWQVLTNIVLPDSPYLFMDTQEPMRNRRFYRVVVVP